MRTRSAAVSLAIVSALFLLPPCLGQTTPPVNVVNVYFTVDDGHGTLIPNLSKDSFEVREDGRPQTIQYFESQTDMPLNVGIVLDSSGLMQGALPAAKVAAADFLTKTVTQKDLAFVISFSVTVDLLQDVTSDLRRLRSGLETAKVNAGLNSSRSGGLLNDAVYLAAEEILSKQVGRKVLVIFTAGNDQGSKVKLKQTVEAAQKVDAICYVVVFSRSIFGSNLSELAEQTGGRLFTAQNGDKLASAVQQIKTELSNQYSLGYRPDNGKNDGSFHAIDLTSKEGYKIRVRRGYYAPGAN